VSAASFGLTLKDLTPVFVDPLPKFDAELKSLKAFLLYKSVPKKSGKGFDKIPYQNGVMSNDRSKDVTYEEAARFLAAHKDEYDGIGHHVQDGYYCIDLDGCISPEAGIEPWAEEIVKESPLHWEQSPSNTGLHGWGKGHKPGPKCRKGNIEIYDGSSTRFITCTGKNIHNPPQIVRAFDITDLYNRLIIGESQQGETTSTTAAPPSISQPAQVQSHSSSTGTTSKFAILMYGDITSSGKPFIIGDSSGSVEYPSHSEADGALCTILAAKYDGDPEQFNKIDADFRLSSLNRKKWEDRADYREDTIKSAIAFIQKNKAAGSGPTTPTQATAAVGTAEPPKPFVIVSGDSFMLETIKPRRVLMQTKTKFEAVFYGKSINQVFAWRGNGKTCLGLGLTAAFATGGSFLNFQSPEPVNVLYIEGELPEEQMQERWKQIIGKTNGRARLVTIDKQPEHGFPSFATAEGMARVEATLAKCAEEGFQIDVLFLDSVSTLFNIAANDEENWIAIQTWLLKLRSQGLCIFFFHHAGKSGLSRSHSKSEDMLDTSIKLETPDEKEEGILHSILVFDKTRHVISEPKAEIKMRSTHSATCACKTAKGRLIGCPGDSVQWEYEVSGALKKKQAFEMFERGASPRKVADDLGVKLGTVKTWRTEYGRTVLKALGEPTAQDKTDAS
jgi:hypothetical protein